MYRVEIPLAQFYGMCLDAAEKAGFIAVLCLVARRADSPIVYEQIVEHWSSIHDLTGDHVLFVFAGTPPGRYNHGVRHTREELMLYSPAMAICNADRLAFPARLNADQLRGDFATIDDSQDVVSTHTLQISELKRVLELQEPAIPCFHFTYLHGAKGERTQTIPISAAPRSSTYGMLKGLMEEWEPILLDIARLRAGLGNVARSQRKYEQERKRLARWAQHSDLDETTREACSELLKVVTQTSLTAEEKKQCFVYIKALKQSESLRVVADDERRKESHDAWMEMMRISARMGKNSARASEFRAQAGIVWLSSFRRSARPESHAQRLLDLSPAIRGSEINRVMSVVHQRNRDLRAVVESIADDQGASASYIRLSDMHFRVAVSFPGEKRRFVSQVVDALRDALGTDSVFYDFDYQAQLARPNLDTLLQRIYRDRSDLIVVFLCAEYAEKQWCGLEWRAVREILKWKQDERVMFVRLDDTSIDGVFSIDGYIDGASHTATQVADFILARVAELEQHA